MTTTRAAARASPGGKAAAGKPAGALPKSVQRETKASSQIVGGLVPRESTAGQPLAPPIRDYFASRIGADLSPVRIAADNPAVASLGAQAMTIGRHIAFAPGAFDPKSRSGLHLIGHELVHTVQQQRGRAASAGGSRDAAEREAEQVSGRVLRGERASVGEARGVGPAFRLQDYQNSLPGGYDEHINALGVSQLQTDIAELTEYLDAQYAGTEETDRLFAIRDRLQARLAALVKTANADPPKPKRAAKGRGKGKAAAPALAPLTPDQIPRILRDRASTPLTDPDEIKHEVDLIIAYLQRGDVSNDERSILRVELQVLAPQFEQVMQADSATRQAKRVQAAFAEAGEGAEGLKRKISIIEAIYDDPSEPLAAFIQNGNERIRISKAQAKQLRADAAANLRKALDRAASTADSAKGLYTEQTKVNDDHPIVSRISGWLGGVDDPGLAMSIAAGVLAANATRAKAELDRGNLSAAVDPLVAASTQARKMEMAVYAWHTGLISGAETAVTGLTFVRDAAFAIDIAIGAVVAAPFVAGAVGAGGLGLTGAAATGTTIVGTGLVVGSGAGSVAGTSEYVGQRIAGADHAQALAAANEQGERRFKEGFAAGAGGATTRIVGQALGPGSTAAGQLTNRLVSQGAGNFVGSTTQAKLNGADLDDALLYGGRQTALGSIGTLAGAPFANGSLLQSTVSTGTSLGVNYLDVRAQGGSNAEALQATAINLATIGALHASPKIERQQAGYEEAGKKFGSGVKSTAVNAKNQIGSYARAGMLGLQLSLPPLRAGNSSGTVPATPSALVASQNEQPASQAAAPPDTKAQAPAASTVAPNVEAEMGIPAAQRTAARNAFRGNLTSQDNAPLGTVWNQVANPGEAATLTAGNSRRLFNNQRNRFWRAVRRDPAALQAIRAMGGIFPEERNGGVINPNATSIPEINLPDGTRLGISIDHQVERQTNPSLALNPNNLRLSTIRENTVVLRQLHDQDPFNNPPPNWTPGP
ncbi:protein of unknown function [Kaistia soli DSM 19436]|uniref:eCIS core domain-containing protein n=1 Tax=Kaistia soli DSM 19436 TaxID=1122133 RepID=A0A1M5G5Z3_9HYPH|nr:DUF4157 domain-containing protein [Kaistia soli]SHF99207.1 protein of unknown function [Kaistia soli DSM 19436]